MSEPLSPPPVTAAAIAREGIPAGLWMRCPECGDMLFKKVVEDNLSVCPACDHHFRVSARTRVKQLSDEGSFDELFADVEPVDPLKFVDKKSYADRIKTEQLKSGNKDALVAGRAFVKGRPLMLAVMDPTFMMGSMGSVVGEKLTRAIEHAAAEKLPLLVVACSGGARMQESTLSLMQMAKTSGALARLDEAGCLYISLLADPTTGGVTASFAMLGDFIIAEPKAYIAFAGKRTIESTTRQELPEEAQRAEFVRDKGFIDFIVHRRDLRSEVARLIDYCVK